MSVFLYMHGDLLHTFSLLLCETVLENAFIDYFKTENKTDFFVCCIHVLICLIQLCIYMLPYTYM